jgi:FKBP-type peptidyl-prolyl cis-trans isomerase 2
MSKAQTGDTVKVAYTGTLEDGTVFDETTSENPLEFTIGDQKIIPGFEKEVVGMEPGEKKSFSISSDDAYGPYNENAVVETSRNALPDDVDPHVGMRLQARDQNGNPIPVVVSEVTEDKIKLDANHPLAGQDLNFEVELVDIEK